MSIKKIIFSYLIIIVGFIEIHAQPGDTVISSFRNRKVKIKSRTDYVIFFKGGKSTEFKTEKRFYDRNWNDTLVEIFSATNGKIFTKFRKKMDSMGLMTEREIYKVSGSTANAGLYLENIHKFTYKNGRILEWSEYDSSGKLMLKNKNEYKYSEDGKVLEILSTGDDERDNTKEVNFYDKSGLKTSYRLYDYKGNIKSAVDYRFDSLRRINGKVIYNKDMQVKNIEYLILRKNGKLKERYEFDADSVPIFKMVFFYNKKGEQSVYIRYPYKKGIDYFKMKTKYNKFGYITRNIKYDNTGKPEKIYKYVYEFYK